MNLSLRLLAWMKRLALLVWLVGMVPPAFSAKLVKPDKVDQLLIHAHDKSDAKVAKQLFNLELTERVSSTRFARWEAELPGPKSRQALVALADASAFLSLPPEEIPATPAPDRAAQDAMLMRAMNYVTDTIPKLPNFFAVRDTTLFSDEPENTESLTLDNSQSRQLHLVGTTSDKVYFRAGKEVVVANAAEQTSPAEKPLATKGIFGEAMELILKDVLPGGPVWSHWEGPADTPLAVFRYAVPLERSHYVVVIPETQPHIAYHGEIAIDPANGTVLRLTIMAELNRSSRISRGDVMVEYGPVEIGNVNYICPVKSVSLTVARAPDSQYRVNPDAMQAGSPDAAKAGSTRAGDLQLSPASTQATSSIISVNDVRFTQYHRFRAEIRIVTGDNLKPATNPPASDVNQP
jgi:hypothetical protein